MPKYRVSLEHRVEEGGMAFDTTATIIAKDMTEAVEVMIRQGLRQGHEATSVNVYVIVEDDK